MKNKFEKSGKRFIKIQDGCDKFCCYCLTIYRRGRSRSRLIKKIVGQVKEAERDGMKEVILTGVDIADFKPSLSKLLKKILKETEKIKIGFGSINLAGVTNELIEVWVENKERMVNYLHIPLQSGCNATLKRMNRKQTIDEYVEKTCKVRNLIRNIRVGTDVMVGYPGETEEEFEESYKNIKNLRFDNLHVFRYSEREGTVAMVKGKEWGWVDEKEKKRRASLMRGLTGK